ncbi:MAG: histidinol-phosphatase HisJ family protein [Candidatus Latescibacteria bacterium]|jgi:histidinol-phosphatase (PHP family)|nr:histidinol-phosphatase HisJ family protein [Candidatus Latescibacterota bacterium]
MTCNSKRFCCLPDYHIHTKLCNHAEGEMEEYVECALQAGLKEIGFSEHMPVMPEPHLCISYEELPIYVSRVLELQEKYKGQISIKLGCEMDIVSGRLDEINDIIRDFQFDYVIGSIHYLNKWPFDQAQYMHQFKNADIDDIYNRFFDAVVCAAETGLYDIAGHIDNIKRMGYRPEGDLTSYYERAAQVFKKYDLTVELNTSGFDELCGEQYPSEEFLKILRRNEIPVTAGSDSHNPKHVGRYYDRAFKMLKTVGYESVVYFKNRERIIKSLESLNGCYESDGPEMR